MQTGSAYTIQMSLFFIAIDRERRESATIVNEAKGPWLFKGMSSNQIRVGNRFILGVFFSYGLFSCPSISMQERKLAADPLVTFI